jgi:hypothetical protein
MHYAIVTVGSGFVILEKGLLAELPASLDKN